MATSLKLGLELLEIILPLYEFYSSLLNGQRLTFKLLAIDVV